MSLLVLDDGRTKVADAIGFDPRNLDAFFRLQTSSPVQLGSFDHRIGKEVDYWDEVLVTGATSTHNANTSSINMVTTTTNGSSAIRQTFRQFEYRRGNAQYIYFSCVLGAPVNNNRRRVGYFDDLNGVFFQVSSSGFAVVRRSSTSGSPVDEVISQADFNQDKLDGTGSSGITLDITKQNLYVIDFSWFGTNIIRFSVVINGKLIPFHIINSANTLSVPWSQTGQLPMRLENTNTGTAPSSATLSGTCFGVFSSGSTTGESRVSSLSSGLTALNVNTTESVLAGIRLRPDRRNISAQAIEYDFVPATGNSFFYYRVLLRPTLTGANWSNLNDLIQQLDSVGTFAGGIVIEQGHLNLQAAGRLRFSVPVKTDAYLGYSIANVPDALVIVGRTTSGSGSTYFNGYFREVY
jgi:hypothetical protein